MTGADRWALAGAEAREIADGLTLGSRLSYERAAELGEQTMAELRQALRERGLGLEDDGEALLVVRLD